MNRTIPILRMPTPPPRREVPFDARATVARTTHAIVRSWSHERRKLIVGAAIAVSWLVAAVLVLPFGTSPDPGAAVVRVRVGERVVSGFFVEGPDDHRYVVTVADAVDGGPIAIEPGLEPAQVVAYDERAGIAVVRTKAADEVPPTLKLAQARVVGAEVVSLGFATRDGASGVTRIDGELDRLGLEQGKARLGLSYEQQPGMEGGPTVDDAGRVVGVNTTGGAADVEDLRALLASVSPAGVPPSAASVTELLRTVQKQVMARPAEARSALPLTSVMAPVERNELARLLSEIRRRDADDDAGADGLSSRAVLRLWEAQLSADGLSTFRSPRTTHALSKCDDATSLLQPASDVVAVPATCSEAGMKALAWDLLAAILRWSGRPRTFTATRVDVTDAPNVFAAEVTAPSLPAPIRVWLTDHMGDLRIKLFDDTGRPYGRAAVDPRSLVGIWEASSAPAPDERVKSATRGVKRTLRIALREDELSVEAHVLHTLAANEGAGFRCNRADVVEVGWSSRLRASATAASIYRPIAEPAAIGNDASVCARWAPPAVRALVFQRVDGDELVVTETDGQRRVETVVFERAASR